MTPVGTLVGAYKKLAVMMLFVLGIGMFISPVAVGQGCPDEEPETCYGYEAAEEESRTAEARESSKYLSQTVVNRVRVLLSGTSGSFASSETMNSFGSGISAGEGEGTLLSPVNLSFDVSYSRTNSSGKFNTDAAYALLMTDKVVNSQRIVGVGLGVERSHRRVIPGRTSVKSEGVTFTGYLAQILNENFTFVPQTSFTYLDRRTYPGAGRRNDSNAWRAFASLGMLGQRRFEQAELSSFGQFVYTYENPSSSAEDRTYVGQVRLNGEASFMLEATTRPFFGATVDYDVTRSESGPRFGYGATAGLRAALESGSLITLSVSRAWREGSERMLNANAFIKIFF